MKYLAIYYAPAEAMAQMSEATEEQKAAGMQMWMDWKARNESLIVDFGAPVMGGEGTNDGANWADSNKGVSGYGVFEADSRDQLKEAFKDHPHVGWHPEATIGIYEFVPIMEPQS